MESHTTHTPPLTHRLGVRLLGQTRIQVLAPGRQLHAERPPDLRHPPALAAEPDDAEPLAVQPGPDGLLPAAADALSARALSRLTFAGSVWGSYGRRTKNRAAFPSGAGTTGPNGLAAGNFRGMSS